MTMGALSLVSEAFPSRRPPFSTLDTPHHPLAHSRPACEWIPAAPLPHDFTPGGPGQVWGGHGLAALLHHHLRQPLLRRLHPLAVPLPQGAQTEDHAVHERGGGRWCVCAHVVARNRMHDSTHARPPTAAHHEWINGRTHHRSAAASSSGSAPTSSPRGMARSVGRSVGRSALGGGGGEL